MTNQRQRTDVEQVGNLSLKKRLTCPNIIVFGVFFFNTASDFICHVTKEAYYQGSKETIRLTSKALKRAIKDDEEE